MYNCSKSSQLFIIIICYNLRYVFLSFEFIKDIYSILFYSTKSVTLCPEADGNETKDRKRNELLIPESQCVFFVLFPGILRGILGEGLPPGSPRPYFRPNKVILPTRFQTWPLKCIAVSRPYRQKSRHDYLD